MRRALLLLTLLTGLVLPGQALAAEVVLADHEGRSITFDVRAEGVDAEWYAALLRAAPHGDEISTVRVVIVSYDELRSTCGRGAAGCYARNTITIPADTSPENAHTVVHEYAHHLDRSTPVGRLPEPNGTSTWWRARGMERLLAQGSVYRSYVRGWDRSIGEIFAEDYARISMAGSPYGIPWLEEPSETVLAAILFDLGLGPEPAIAPPPALKPVSIARRGSLAPRETATVPFGLLGPGRRVEATATFAGSKEQGARARLEIRCDGRRVALTTLRTGRTTVKLDRRNLGPADECLATLTSASTSTRAYALTVRLSIPGGA